MNELMSHEPVDRTAPATPGLLMSCPTSGQGFLGVSLMPGIKARRLLVFSYEYMGAEPTIFEPILIILIVSFHEPTRSDTLADTLADT